jgi:hypothetical protein
MRGLPVTSNNTDNNMTTVKYKTLDDGRRRHEWWEPQKPVPEETLLKLCESLGYDPNDVRSIELWPDKVMVTKYLRNAKGNKYVWGTSSDPCIERGHYEVSDLPAEIGEAAVRVFGHPVVYPEAS